MWIHLLRHGIAFDREDPRCPPDPQRPLTDKGVSRTRAAVKGMRCLGLEPDLILTSPYLRARQTADIVRDVLAPEAAMKQLSVLVPEGKPSKMLQAIWDTKAKAPMCVGHAPSLDEFAAYAIGCDPAAVKLKKAGLLMLQIESPDKGTARLHAMLPPAMTRAVGA